MIKKLAMAAALLFTAHLNMNAGSSIVINRTDNLKEVINLDSKPVLYFSDDDLCIDIDAEYISLSIPRAEIAHMQFIADSGIADTKAETALDVIDSNTLRITASEAATVHVFDIAGRAAGGALVSTDGNSVTISLDACPSGIYVIVYNNKSLKFTKK